MSAKCQKRIYAITSVSAVFNDLTDRVVAHRTLKGALIVARAIVGNPAAKALDDSDRNCRTATS